MTFQKTVKFDGYTVDDEREEVIFETAFNPIRRVFEYPDLMQNVALIAGANVYPNGEITDAPRSVRAKKAGESWTSDVVGWMQGGLLSHVVLDSKSVRKRFLIAKQLYTALSRDMDPTIYGSTNKRAVQALIEARERQIGYLEKAIHLLNSALNELDLNESEVVEV